MRTLLPPLLLVTGQARRDPELFATFGWCLSQVYYLRPAVPSSSTVSSSSSFTCHSITLTRRLHPSRLFWLHYCIHSSLCCSHHTTSFPRCLAMCVKTLDLFVVLMNFKMFFVLTRKTESEKNILGDTEGRKPVLTRGPKSIWTKMLFVCVWSSAAYLWISYFFLISHRCAFETASVWNRQKKLHPKHFMKVAIQQLLSHLRQSGGNRSRNKKGGYFFFFFPLLCLFKLNWFSKGRF